MAPMEAANLSTSARVLTEVTSFHSEAIAEEHDMVVGASAAQQLMVVVVLLCGADLLLRLVLRPDATVMMYSIRPTHSSEHTPANSSSAPARRRPTHQQQPTPPTFISAAFAAAVVAFVAHYADNIARPGAYAEPRWMFDARLLAQMEITFFGGLVKWLLMRSYAWRSPAQRLLLAVIGTFSLGHYAVAPPSRYSLWCHATILTDGICPSILFLVSNTNASVS